MAPPVKPLKTRIVSNINIDGDCWIWTGPQTRDGYGSMNCRRKNKRAHRVSYEAFVGDIPSGMFVCHRCDKPLCVNPDHLFLGTPKENTQDMIAKDRHPRPSNLNHPNTKVPHEDRDRIRRRRASGETLKTIAKDYGVSFQTVSAICKGARSYGAR